MSSHSRSVGRSRTTRNAPRAVPAALIGGERQAGLKKGIPMPRGQWSKKRERQYEHIKESALDRGESEDTAEEIAARTVNKERARHGESKEASKLSTSDISSGRRGGLRSHKGAGGRTYDQLYEEAKARKISGRSRMTKRQLQKALGER